MITMREISKSFRVSRRKAGFAAAAKALFHKEYDVVQALDRVSFTIGDGEMVGYIGPNGAGKSSTIKIMSGILTPDSGQCVINGRVPWKNRVEHVREIGVVFGQRSQLWWDVPVADSFELLRDIYQVPEQTYRHNVEELTELLDLSTLLRTPTRQLSLGQRMRCEIAASLLHGPKVLFLDEPTIGLDAVSKLAVREFIKRLNREKKTTVLLIGRGRILMDGDLQTLKKENTVYKTLTVEYSGGQLPQLAGATVQQSRPGRATLRLDVGVLPVPEAIAAISRQVGVTDLSVTGGSVDDLVVSLYQKYHI